MKDEIKEINIKMPGQILDYVDTKEHLLELFNHITNLQEEYERLNNQYDLNGNFIKTWNSMIEIERNLGINISYVHLCCNNKIKKIKEFNFKYYNDFTD